MDYRNKSREELNSELQELLKENNSLKFLKEKRAAELVTANEELVFQNREKEKRADELVIAKVEKAEREEALTIANAEKAMRAAEVIISNTAKAKRAAELVIANAEKAKSKSLTAATLKRYSQCIIKTTLI